MSQPKTDMKIALNSQNGLFWVFAVFFIAVGLGLLALYPAVIREDGWIAALLLSVLVIPISMLLLNMGASSLIQAASYLELAPEEVRVRLFGRKIFSLPAEELAGLYVAWVRVKFGYGWQIGLSDRSIPELARLQEQRLAKGIFTRNELPFMKRSGDWQRKFAEQYLLRDAKREQLFLRSVKKAGKGQRKGILWLGWSEELLALLRYMYPNVPVETVPCKEAQWSSHNWKDKDPTRFCRGFEKVKNATPVWGLAAILAVICLCPLPLLFLGPGEPGVWAVVIGYCVLMSAMMGPALLYGWQDSDIFTLTQEGISIERGKRKEFFPASGIYAILSRPKETGRGDIRICLADRPSCVEQQILWLQKRNNRRLWLQAIQQLPDWEHWLMVGYCTRSRWNLGKKQAPVQKILYTPQREQLLRQLYPDALWLEDE